MTLVDLSFRPDQIRSLYLIHLQQMCSAEEQLLPAVPTVAIGISDLKIRELLLHEAVMTPDHLDLLQEIFTELGETPTGPICQPVKALVEQSMMLILQHPFGPGRDLLLIAMAMELKYLNIAKYTMAMTFAHILDFPQQHVRLSKVMRDEMETERTLRFALQNVPKVIKAAEALRVETEAAVIFRPPQA